MILLIKMLGRKSHPPLYMEKLILPFILLVCLSTPEFAQQTAAEWQREAIRQFPELASRDTKLNKQFVLDYKRLQLASPQFFTNPQWPMILARQCDGELRAMSSPSPSPALTTPIGDASTTDTTRSETPAATPA